MVNLNKAFVCFQKSICFKALLIEKAGEMFRNFIVLAICMFLSLKLRPISKKVSTQIGQFHEVVVYFQNLILRTIDDDFL